MQTATLIGIIPINGPGPVDLGPVDLVPLDLVPVVPVLADYHGQC